MNNWTAYGSLLGTYLYLKTVLSLVEDVMTVVVWLVAVVHRKVLR